MKKILIAVVVIIILGVGYYALSPLFRNIEVNDALPEGVVSSGFEELSTERQEEMTELMEQVNQETMPSMEDSVPGNMAGDQVSEIMATKGHPAQGTVRVLKTTEGRTIIRYEDFETINGPNLHVYLSKDLEGNDFIDLGPIKGTRGNINYEVPEGINITEYSYVMYWCVPFSVLFNYAEI